MFFPRYTVESFCVKARWPFLQASRNHLFHIAPALICESNQCDAHQRRNHQTTGKENRRYENKKIFNKWCQKNQRLSPVIYQIYYNILVQICTGFMKKWDKKWVMTRSQQAGKTYCGPSVLVRTQTVGKNNHQMKKITLIPGVPSHMQRLLPTQRRHRAQGEKKRRDKNRYV